MHFRSALIRAVLQITTLLAVASGCGANDPDPGSDAVTITGPSGALVMGLERQYSVTVPEGDDGGVLWSLPDGETAGTLTSDGLFTAGTTAGTWRIAVSLNSDPTQADTLLVNVIPYMTSTSLGLPAYGVAVSAAGVIAAADNSTAVRFRDGGNVTTATTGSLPVHLAFAPNGATAFATSMGGRLFRINVATGAVVDTADFGRAVYNIAIRSTDSLVYVTTDDGWLLKVAPSTLTTLDSVKLASASNGVAFSPGGGVLWASTINAGILYRIDPTTLAKTDSFPLEAGLQRLAVAPSGDSVFVANQSSHKVHVVRPSTRTVTAVVLTGSPHGVGLSSDGSKLFVAHLGGWVTVLNRSTLSKLGLVPLSGSGRNVASIPGTAGVVVSVEFDLLLLE
jgi:YVTN family beta-propeller protein